VKPDDTPDFVRHGYPRRDRHSSGPGVAHLGSVLPTR
jgi:hypothetical protein